MARPIDNRMGWIRNLEKLKSGDSRSFSREYELASETYIPGLLNYENETILCSLLTFEKGDRGLYKYALKIRFAESEERYPNSKASRKGYLLKEGIPGELIALFSLHFRCRFYMISAFAGDLSPQGTKIKFEYNPLYRPPGPYFDPTNFANGKRNFATGLSAFLDQIAQINVQYHQQLILACHHYAKGLKEFGLDEEMVFIRLVSAIEAVSKWVELRGKNDLFNGKNFNEIVKSNLLSKDQYNELRNLFEVRNAKLRFKRFIEQYSRGFFKGGNYKTKYSRIAKAQLSRKLDAIYNSRSDYLHRGEPMYLSLPMRGNKKWDTDPSLDMIIDNRRFSRNKKLPYGSFFQRLVRHCLLEFIKEISSR